MHVRPRKRACEGHASFCARMAKASATAAASTSSPTPCIAEHVDAPVRAGRRVRGALAPRNAKHLGPFARACASILGRTWTTAALAASDVLTGRRARPDLADAIVRRGQSSAVPPASTFDRTQQTAADVAKRVAPGRHVTTGSAAFSVRLDKQPAVCPAWISRATPTTAVHVGVSARRDKRAPPECAVRPVWRPCFRADWTALILVPIEPIADVAATSVRTGRIVCQAVAVQSRVQCVRLGLSPASCGIRSRTSCDFPRTWRTLSAWSRQPPGHSVLKQHA